MIATFSDASSWLVNALVAGIVVGLIARLTKVGR